MNKYPAYQSRNATFRGTSVFMLEQAQSFSGVKTFTDGISVSAGISLSGDVITSSGQVRTYNNFSTAASNWNLGPSSVLDGSSLSAQSTYGVYVANGAWDTSNNSTHTVSASLFLMNSANTNVSGTFRVFASNKAASGTKLGVITADYLLQSGSSAQVFTVSTTKSSNLTSFSVAASSSNVVVTTDSDCRVCWSFTGAV